jgi:hypothetical protein
VPTYINFSAIFLIIPQRVEKASQSSRPQARNKSNPFFLATCASEKTLLGLQTWILSAIGGQNMRCGRPQSFVEKGYDFFDSLS